VAPAAPGFLEKYSSRATAGLDRADALAVGRGHVDLFGFAGPDALGAGMDLSARVSSRVSAFGSAWGGWDVENGNRLTWGALGGLRTSW
jgi:hypothetical protein